MAAGLSLRKNTKVNSMGRNFGVVGYILTLTILMNEQLLTGAITLIETTDHWLIALSLDSC